MSKLNWELFKPKFGEWDRYMQEFFEGEKAFEIYKKLKECKNRGNKILPESKNTFKAFEIMPPRNLQLIIIGMEPYASVYRDGNSVATGIALDCSNSVTGAIQPSLFSFYDGIAKEYNQEPEYSYDLGYLNRQGVLLLNKSLTVIEGQIASHSNVWDDFQQYFLEEIVTKNFPGVPILLLGKQASLLQRFISPSINPLFVLTHPSYAARKNIVWDTENAFTEINKLIGENTGVVNKIHWFEKEYNKWLEDCPF